MLMSASNLCQLSLPGSPGSCVARQRTVGSLRCQRAVGCAWHLRLVAHGAALGSESPRNSASCPLGQDNAGTDLGIHRLFYTWCPPCPLPLRREGRPGKIALHLDFGISSIILPRGKSPSLGDFYVVQKGPFFQGFWGKTGVQKAGPLGEHAVLCAQTRKSEAVRRARAEH
jgi:hypothetical protein